MGWVYTSIVLVSTLSVAYCAFVMVLGEVGLVTFSFLPPTRGISGYSWFKADILKGLLVCIGGWASLLQNSGLGKLSSIHFLRE